MLALILAALVAAPSPIPTLPPLPVTVVAGPRVPIGPTSVPRDFTTLSNVADEADGAPTPALAASFRPTYFQRGFLDDLLGLGPAAKGQSKCPDRGVRPILAASQITDSIITANAVHRGSMGVRVFGSSSAVGYIAEALLTDLVVHRVEVHASCGIKTATDLLLTGATLNNAANAEFPR